MDTFAFQLLSTLVALAFVIALAWISLKVLRGRMPGAAAGGAAGTGALRFLRALPVGPRERVVLIEHRGEQMLLGVTAGGISMLGRWPAAGGDAATAADAER